MALLIAAGATPLSAGAQSTPEQHERVPAFGRSMASVEDATALVVNPAGLGLLPGAELRWSSVYLDERSVVPWQGHALGFAFPLPLIPLSTGLRLDFVDPPRDASGPNYRWFTWGLALRGSDRASLGMTWQRQWSTDRRWHGLSSFSLGTQLRLTDGFSFGAVAENLGSPHNDHGGRLPVNYGFGATLRPLGTSDLELSLESRYVDAALPYWAPRGVVGIGLPHVGRLRGDLTWVNPDERNDRPSQWIASTALEFDLNAPDGSTQASIGSLYGSLLGPQGKSHPESSLTTEIALRSWREHRGVDAPGFAVRIRLDSTPDSRGHVALLRKLWQLADDPGVKAVILQPTDKPAASLAATEELRDALQLLEAHGKQVLCHLEDGSGSALQLCAAANRTLVHPAGGLRLSGMRLHTFYFRSLLSKLGIAAEFVRIGEHKSAPESFTRDEPTEVARKDNLELLSAMERRVVAEIAEGRHLSPDAMMQTLAEGPFVSSEAKRAGLVDDYAYEDELEAALRQMLGRAVPIIDSYPAARQNGRFGAVPQVAIVYLDGDMVDGRSQAVPFIGMQLAGSRTLASTLQTLRRDPSVGAVVLRIESPGGSALAADVLWREVQLTSAVKPVVVSMGGVAASGGYYAASPATRIFANPLSVCGSIGVFYGKADVSGLLSKLGVHVEVTETQPRTDLETLFRPYTPEERTLLEKKVGQFYAVFLSRVALGRHLSEDAVDAVGRGKVFTGEQAVSAGLVDELGGLRQALIEARHLAGLPAHAPIVELPVVETSLLGQMLGMPGVREPVVLPAQVMDAARALGPFMVYDGHAPLARMEFGLQLP